MKAKKLLLRLLFGLLAVLFWILVWWLVARSVGNPLLLPAPPAVIGRLWKLLRSASFYGTALLSIGRILSGILVGALIAVPIAVLSARVPFFSTLFRPLLTVIRATPVAAFIILLWLWMGGDRVPAVITALIVLPVVAKNLEEGLRSTDPALRETAVVFRLSPAKRVCALDLPSVRPYLRASLETAIGLGWKSGIAAEIIVRPAKAIGRMISDAKYSLEYVDIFAWTLAVILLSVLIERLFGLLLRGVLGADSETSVKRENGL